ncbi:hypothetical protein EJ05DRAFT_508369 [Pseudovirgaria hyperparasitica]|uniref:protein-ribulosamine 3-kinase n=1 Tax=Pseudovirgaria hyperparasitica TaxID=470096 RepID=A0A6A6WF58_9PEZI|nr:uncharacterized protein EJ05DRAFT_508369 [Pseudovirgaria hyperparasitica]KAF2761175.1 hypothetical protein EJ05DRAFT_508369 [Pseudovirgaria hyperparasitica]
MMDAISKHGIDENVLRSLPSVASVTKISRHGASAWTKRFRIDVQHTDQTKASYFMKLSLDHHGKEALKGEYEGTAALHDLAPELVPKPIAWGSLESKEDTHFYLTKFYELGEQLPSEADFCKRLADLHHKHCSPNGKYGFHVTTYNGDLPQDNTYADTWEEFFVNGLKHVLALNRERGGVSEELESLVPDLLEKVIPRLLRPLETGGNSIKPSLVHGDLWCGNAAIDQEDDKPIIFDPSSFWAHNEYELGNWRPARNKFSQSYFNAYHSHFPKASPEEDYDDRNALYALRFNLHAATLFPNMASFREMVIEEARRLIAKFPEGYDSWAQASAGASEH